MIEKNDVVTLEYEGKLENGQIFDASKHGDHSHPLEFKVGSGMVIKGFDDAVLGMKEGEEKEFTINPEDGYGMPRPELKQKVPRENLPKDQEPQPGMTLIIQTPQGQLPATIAEVSEKEVTLDLNHPLAGKKLIFKIQITKIEKDNSEKQDKKE